MSQNLQEPRHILSLTQEEKRQLVSSFDYIFSDIDGVLWNQSHPIPGSAEGLRFLQGLGKKLVFITNNSMCPEQQIIDKLHEQNIEVEANDLIYPAKTVAEYLRRHQFEGQIYLIATDNFKNYLLHKGFQITDGPNKIINESVSELLHHVLNQEPVKAVIIDSDFNLNLLKMMKATYFLCQYPDCLLIGGASDLMIPVATHLSVMGPGVFLKSLELASGREALLLGKPGQELAKLLLDCYRIKEPRRALMIGDMVEPDIRFGRLCGFQTLLVLSGGCSLEQMRMNTNNGRFRPDFYADSMSDFKEFMNDL